MTLVSHAEKSDNTNSEFLSPRHLNRRTFESGFGHHTPSPKIFVGTFVGTGDNYFFDY